MQIQTNVSLKNYSTMRLGGDAAYFAEVKSEDDLAEALEFAESKSLPVRVIGGGSNIIWRDEGYDGLVIHNLIKGFKINDSDDDSTTITVGAGENWDKVVERTVELKLSGLEAMSLIPGSAGATPVQNVEAYGQEIADTLVSIRAYDLEQKKYVGFGKEDCEFSYRSSRFKTHDNGRYIITSLVVRLHKDFMHPPFHAGLQNYIDKHGITDFSPHSIRWAIIDIRSSKLPDPKEHANNGSFFNNAIISIEHLKQLQEKYPDIPHYPMHDGHEKIPARWLIETAGFKAGYRDEKLGMLLWPKQALVFVNDHATSLEQLEEFRDHITSKVEKKFGITLRQEPEVLGS